MEAAAGNVEYNISHGFKLMEEAASSSDMVVLPELWTIARETVLDGHLAFG